MLEQVKVYHFSNSKEGGVFSVIKNLLQFSINPVVENHIIYTINKEITPHFELPHLTGAGSQQIFYFSPKWNFYYTCKQLSKLLPNDTVVIIAHDWLELGMVSNLGLQNPVVHFLHGDFDYYYALAKRHVHSIDQFIAISPVIDEKLSSVLPERRQDIHYCRFPVPSIDVDKKENDVLKIFYGVRSLTEERKQFKILPLIKEQLDPTGIDVQWTVVGAGMEKEQIQKLMRGGKGLSIYPALSNEAFIKELQCHDLFLLPSLQEGFPVAVVEAMKAGLVPLITNWEGATEELVIEGKTGFVFSIGNVEGYANTIAKLDADRFLLSTIRAAAIKKANELFDPFVNTKNIERVIIQDYYGVKKDKTAFKAYGSRLDKEWIPNAVTKTVREFTGDN
ncbi:MAG: glycosyltransferase family 4 protein [Ginsengibacter sp.]